MQLQKNKTLSTIALILILTVSAFMASMPTAEAHTPPVNIATYAYLTVVPNPVGVGQTATVVFWLSEVPPTANGGYGDKWQGFTVAVTKPDGTTQTLGPFNSDPVGNAYTFFAPDKTGNYTFQMSYPGQKLAGANPPPVPNIYSTSAFINDTFQPSTSSKVTLTVQQQPIQSFSDIPLPTDYWSRPINGENRLWYSIGENWLGTGIGSRGSNFFNATGNVMPYTKGPTTAHIVWTRPLALGGVIGGDYGGGGTSEYYTGTAYEPKFTPPVIINGRLYYNAPDPPKYGFYCVDLHTGETIWYNNGTSVPQTEYSAGSYMYPAIGCGQILNYISPNQYGGIPYLWYVPFAPPPSTGGAQATPTYIMYDAFTGNWICTFVNGSIPSAVVMDPSGNMLVYVFSGAGKWLAMWNSTLAMPQSTDQLNYYWLWRPRSGIFNWLNGIQWNVSLANVPSQALMRISGNTIWARRDQIGSDGNPIVTDLGYSLSDGSLMWMANRTGREAYALYPGSYASIGFAGSAAGNGVYVVLDQDTNQWYGYSLATGTLVWGPTQPYYGNAWDMYPAVNYIADGKLYAQATTGIHCFDVTTGQHLWDWSAGSSGLETPYGTWPVEAGGMLIADGKIYVGSAHTHLQPLFRGANLYCIDATSGQELWNVTGWFAFGATSGALALSDGYLVADNGYTNSLYCFGKGQTATTVSAPQMLVSLGSHVLIQGTVTDQSPGAKGTPAISDNDMTPWMDYLYNQEPLSAGTIHGVPVTLTAFDPNGNTQNIGTVSSDMKGNYAIDWAPPVPGIYKITATFAGSNSYFSSSAETAMDIGPAAAPAPTATPPATAIPPPTVTPSPSPQVTTTPVPPPSSPGVPTTYIVIAVVAIIIVVAAAALALRRRK